MRKKDGSNCAVATAALGWRADIAFSRSLHQLPLMRSEKDPLPKGLCYPLKPSALEAALKVAKIEIDTSLVRSRRSVGAFNASFWVPNQNVPYERLNILVGAIPAIRLAEVSARIETILLPRLVSWIENILSLDEQSVIRRDGQALILGPL